jgi:hypothetical protein
MRHRWARLTTAGLLSILLLANADVAQADADGSVTLDGIDIVAKAVYSCGSDEVDILPASMTPVDGNYPVIAVGFVYDNENHVWLKSPQWYRVDGITTLTFKVNVEPYQYAWMQYGVFSNGRWDQAGAYVPIADAIDNSPAFCQ